MSLQDNASDNALESTKNNMLDVIKKWNWKKIGIIVAIVAVILLVIYFGLSIFFQSHFYFRSTVNGANSSAASVQKVQNRLDELSKNYVLTIEDENGKTEQITPADVDLKISTSQGKVEHLLENQNGFDWIGALIHPKNYISESIASYDEQKLVDKIAVLNCITNTDVVKTQNATYSYQNNKFEIADEVYGTEIDPAEFEKVVGKALSTFKTTLNLKKDKCYKQPTILADNKDLKSLVKEMNRRLDTKIVYKVGSSEEQVPTDVIASSMGCDDKLQLTCDSAKLADYVASMSKKYNTFGLSKKLATSYGTTVTVPGGNYGWKIDKKGEAEQLSKDILAGDNVSRDFVYAYKAASREGNDYGNSYVEINLTAQHLFLYVDGSKVTESDFVSGNVSKGNGTPAGAYRITYTEKDAVLRGDNYASNVSFWMPFNGNIGLHDASWRSSYGGSIYLHSGSHGCVNLPYSAAQTIFNHISTGFPVLAYTLPGTESYSLDTNAANNVMNLINGIGSTITLQSESAIVDARNQYNALSNETKALVTNLPTLEAAEANLSQLKSNDDTEHTNADYVIGLINQIGDVTLNSKDSIHNARSAYNALSTIAKSYVSNYNTLTAAEDVYGAL